MKKLILSLFVLMLSIFSYSQYPSIELEEINTNDTVFKYSIDGEMEYMLIYDTMSIDSVSSYWVYKKDTVDIILLLCDTTSHSTYNSDNELIPYYNLNVYWKFGYLILGRYSMEFLDNRKKPFDKNIVIWDYKEIQ